MPHPLILSRFSIVTCLGAGQNSILHALKSGNSGLRPNTFAGASIDTFTGEVPGLDNVMLPAHLSRFECRNNRLAMMALEQDGFAATVAAAREKYGSHRIGVFLGTSTSGILQAELAYCKRSKETGALPENFHYAETQNTYSVADFVMRYLRLDGPALVVSAACATTAKAFGNAARMIAAGFCDAAIVGGADTLCLTTLYGFQSLQLTSETACQPFDVARNGISIGEGAGFTLLEKASPSDNDDSIKLLAVGESSDAYHMSTPHPEGLGARLAMERALVAAGLRTGDIDYINLHGTATRVGDAAEDCAVSGLFGNDTPCSSTKGHTGHTLGASGIVEAIISALCLRHQIMPGSPQTRTIDPAFRSHYVMNTRQARIDRILSNSFGFGGSNCSLIFGRAGA